MTPLTSPDPSPSPNHYTLDRSPWTYTSATRASQGSYLVPLPPSLSSSGPSTHSGPKYVLRMPASRPPITPSCLLSLPLPLLPSPGLRPEEQEEEGDGEQLEEEGGEEQLALWLLLPLLQPPPPPLLPLLLLDLQGGRRPQWWHPRQLGEGLHLSLPLLLLL